MGKFKSTDMYVRRSNYNDNDKMPMEMALIIIIPTRRLATAEIEHAAETTIQARCLRSSVVVAIDMAYRIDNFLLALNSNLTSIFSHS